MVVHLMLFSQKRKGVIFLGWKVPSTGFAWSHLPKIWLEEHLRTIRHRKDSSILGKRNFLVFNEPYLNGGVIELGMGLWTMR